AIGDRGAGVLNCRRPVRLAKPEAKAEVITPCKGRVRRCISGLELERLLEQRNGLFRIFGRVAVGEGRGPQHKVVGIETFGPLALGSLDLRFPEARLDGADDAHRDLVLQGEDVVEGPIIALRPDMASRLRLQQLAGNANAIADLAHAAFEHISHAELASDPTNVRRLALVGKARIAPDDEEPFDARQAGDNVIDHAVAEIILLAVAAHVLKRQHRNRRLFERRQSRPRRARLARRLEHDAIDAHRLRNVLQRLLADIDEARRHFALDLPPGILGNRDVAGLGDALEPRRDVDAVAIDVFALEDDVADADADAEYDSTILRHTRIDLLHGPLNCHSAFDGVHDARELDELAIAHEFDDTSAMLADFRIDGLFAERLERSERRRLVRGHEPAVSHHVCGKDRRQPSLQALFGHADCSPRSPICAAGVYGRLTSVSNAGLRLAQAHKPRDAPFWPTA